MANEHLVTPFFTTEAVEDLPASLLAGRPIFKEMELVEVRIAGDRNFAPVFPALSMWMRDGNQEISYAERWPEQYARFKEGAVQVADGTPLDELPFLTVGRRAELKALKIYTAEALAALDGRNLKVLAGEGHKLKEAAQAYLDKANGTANIIHMVKENSDLKSQLDTMKAQIEALQRGQPLQPQAVERQALPPADDFGDMTDAQLKDEIAKLTGNRPQGNPNRGTLLSMLDSLTSAAA